MPPKSNLYEHLLFAEFCESLRLHVDTLAIFMESFFFSDEKFGMVWLFQITALSEATPTNTKRSRRKKVNLLVPCYQNHDDFNHCNTGGFIPF